jgi:hypothetical protein
MGQVRPLPVMFGESLPFRYRLGLSRLVSVRTVWPRTSPEGMPAVSSLILAFTRSGDEGVALVIEIPLPVAGIVGLWALANSALFDRILSRLVERMLDRYTELEIRDYAGLLRLGGDYRIAELLVEEGGWLAGRSLAEARPAAEGILVLGINESSGCWFGTPDGDTRLGAGDTLVVYGRTEAIKALRQRRRGEEAAREQQEAIAMQDQIRPTSEWRQGNRNQGTASPRAAADPTPRTARTGPTAGSSGRRTARSAKARSTSTPCPSPSTGRFEGIPGPRAPAACRRPGAPLPALPRAPPRAGQQTGPRLPRLPQSTGRHSIKRSRTASSCAAPRPSATRRGARPPPRGAP